MDLSVVIVTSPSKSNPAITLIEQVIDSLKNFTGLEDAPIIIVMDGFEVFGMGIVTIPNAKLNSSVYSCVLLFNAHIHCIHAYYQSLFCRQSKDEKRKDYG